MKRNGKQLMAAGVTSLVLSGVIGVAAFGGVASACASEGDARDSGTYQHVSWRSDRSDDRSGHEVSMDDEDMMNSDVRVAAHAVLREHAAVTVPALKAELLQSPDKDAAMAAVNMNSEAIANAVDMAVPGSKAEFLALWQSHIDYYVEYLHATKNGDAAGQAEAKQNLATFAEQFSDWLVAHNPNYDKDELMQQVTMHGDQVVHIIDSLVAEDYDEVYTTAHEAYEHMGMLADTLIMGWMDSSTTS